MGLASAAWCIGCGALPEVVITLERRGVMMHYGACFDHVLQVAERARRDVERIDAPPATKISGYVDTSYEAAGYEHPARHELPSG